MSRHAGSLDMAFRLVPIAIGISFGQAKEK
jgi:hypothetical protein